MMKKCPECGEKLLTIVYGMPTAEAFDRAEEKGLYFAGCCVDKYKYHCKKCGVDFTENLKESHREDDLFADEEDDG